MASKDGSTFFFTSESVNEGHPDKLADQVRGATPRFRPAPAPTARRLLQGKKLLFLFAEQASHEKSGATTLPPGKRARRDASTARTDFSIERERTELTLIPPAPSRRADLRCRARRVPRRGSRLQGAFSRPFCEGRFSRCLTSMIDDERRAMAR